MRSIIEPAILSTAYFPNIQYVSKLLLHKNVYIDIHETYLKQSFRNRCQIAGANGPLDLTIPVIKPNGNHSKTKDILIDYSTKWMQVHWRAIVSAYKSSPFFEFFEHDFFELFQKEEKFLIDFNYKVLQTIFKSLDANLDLIFSNQYFSPTKSDFDFRNTIHPKKRMQSIDPDYLQLQYYQVFQSKNGFLPNLSFIDLVFNEGPQAFYVCQKSIPGK